jgi:hypothetical protein
LFMAILNSKRFRGMLTQTEFSVPFIKIYFNFPHWIHAHSELNVNIAQYFPPD